VRIFLFFWTLMTVCLPPALAQEQPPAKVVVREAVREVIAENRPFIGILVFDRTSRVSTEVPGLVDQVFVEEGDLVSLGDPLVSLDTELLDKEIALRRARLEQVRLRLELAKKNLGRAEILLARKGTSEKNYDDARYAYEDSLEEKRSSELELEKLLIQKRKSTITAPFDAVILKKNVETGDWVQQGTNVAEAGAISELVIRVPVEESLLRFIIPGKQVPVTINAFARELTGTILRFEPIADPRTKNVFVKIGIPPQEHVAENMSATVYVPTGVERELTVVPRDAVVNMQGRDFVFTVSEGKAAMRQVNIAAYLGDRIGTDTPGLLPGTPVVIEGNERLRPDQPVVVAEDR